MSAASNSNAATIPPVMLSISEADVESSISMPAGVHISAQSFLSHYEGTAAIPSYAAIVEQSPANPTTRNASLFKPAQVEDALGMKIVCIRPDNANLGLPTVPAIVLLSDRLTGFPVAAVQATYLTAFRTAAGSAAATHAGSRPNSSRLLVFGAGMQAREHIKAMICVRPVKHVDVVNRSAKRAVDLVKLLHPLYPQIIFTVHTTSDSSASDKSTLAKAIKSADIICTTTNSFEPLISLDDVSPGVHINAIGSYLPHMHELSSSLVAAARIAVDTAVDSVEHAGDIHTPMTEGVLSADRLVHVGAYLSRSQYGSPFLQPPFGTAPEAVVGFRLQKPKDDWTPPKVPLWRQSESDITLFKSVGSAAQDVTTAYAVLQVQRARATQTK